MDYGKYYEKALREHRFIEHVAGDTSCFRYPHMQKWADLFRYDPDLQVFMFTGTDEQLKEIAAEDITVYEFIAPQALRLHASDMLSCTYTDEDRQAAFQEVYDSYQHRKEIFSEAEVRTIRAGELVLRPDFSCVRDIYRGFMDIPVKLVILRKGTFPFGSVLKGTNIIITDGNRQNLGQDMIHMLFHLKEGIEGPDSDNLYVNEIWADVPALYALQLLKGRMARRTRTRTSPHTIHFTDYIYLRAYLGQAFTDEDCSDLLHPVYSMIEPAAKLIFHALREKPAAEMNRILADAVLCDDTAELIEAFDGCFGDGSFKCIFDQYSLYDKYELAGRYLSADERDRIMFGSEEILNTGVRAADVTEFWRKRINEDNALLPACIL